MEISFVSLLLVFFGIICLIGCVAIIMHFIDKECIKTNALALAVMVVGCLCIFGGIHYKKSGDEKQQMYKELSGEKSKKTLTVYSFTGRKIGYKVEEIQENDTQTDGGEQFEMEKGSRYIGIIVVN